MLSFKEWLKTTCYHSFKSDIGKFVQDIFDDPDFPIACEKYVMYIYLSSLDKKQLDMFEKLYDEYIRFISRRYSDDPISY